MKVIIVIVLATAAAPCIVPSDNLLVANAQPSQLDISQSASEQQEVNDEEEEAVVRQGTVISSQDPLPGHEDHQRATILPFREDGTIYSGVLTYTATEPVEIAIVNMQTLNETEQSILNATDDGELGTLFTTQLDNQTSLSISYVTPSYVGSPVPSASIPFVGNAIWLHTLSGEPFASTFVVNAHVLPSQIQNNINTPEEITDDIATPEDDGGDTGENEDADIENASATDTEGIIEEEEIENATATTTVDDDDGIASTATNEEEDDDGVNNEEAIVRIPQGSSSLTDDAYAPNPIEVSIGDTVTWINDDLTSHTATSGTPDSGATGMFGGTDDSPEIIGPEGDTQSVTFDEAGEFEYYCTLHPNMVGTVVVTEG
jgi:plastocyanin